jgi:hypothetical protein
MNRRAFLRGLLSTAAAVQLPVPATGKVPTGNLYIGSGAGGEWTHIGEVLSFAWKAVGDDGVSRVIGGNQTLAVPLDIVPEGISFDDNEGENE